MLLLQEHEAGGLLRAQAHQIAGAGFFAKRLRLIQHVQDALQDAELVPALLRVPSDLAQPLGQCGPQLWPGVSKLVTVKGEEGSGRTDGWPSGQGVLAALKSP